MATLTLRKTRAILALCALSAALSPASSGCSSDDAAADASPPAGSSSGGSAGGSAGAGGANAGGAEAAAGGAGEAAGQAGASGGAAGGGGASGDKPSTAPCKDPAFVGKPLGVRCGQLVDTEGRVVFLKGVNARVEGVFDVTFSDGRTPLETVPPFTADDAEALFDFGFDALRLPINWSGVEPTESGGFDEAYLDRVAAVVDHVKAAGGVVLIDFHQDAYSKEIGEDGAPLWAIEPPPTMLLEGPLTDLNERRFSKQVNDAFATFFGESDKGAMLRTRFAKMAGHVADRFKGEDAVIGFEIFNEPVFTSVERLKRLHEEVYAEIRAKSPEKLVLFEPSAERNFLDKALGGTLPKLGEGTAYAPHFYKLAFDGQGDTNAARMKMTKETLRPQVKNANEEAEFASAARISTEWGYAPDGIKANEYYVWQAELHEEYQWSTFFWLWKEESQGSWGCFDHDKATGAYVPRERIKNLLARVRPQAVSGWPETFSFDRPSGKFSMSFTSDPTVTAPSKLMVAKALGAPLSVTCDGAPAPAGEETPDAHGVLTVTCGVGDGAKHVIEVTVTPPTL